MNEQVRCDHADDDLCPHGLDEFVCPHAVAHVDAGEPLSECGDEWCAMGHGEEHRVRCVEVED